MANDYYALLGVEPDASQEEIKRAFRRLARELHPDATGGDADSERRYKEISEAYSVLSDPRKRREYDASRMGVGAGSPFSSTIEDLFDSFFGGAGVRQRGGTRARRGESIEVAVELDLPEAVFGAERTLRFERHEPCSACEGSGCAPGSHPERCGQCGGSGQVQQTRRTVLGSLVTAYPCVACAQSGWVVPNPCDECGGVGRGVEDIEIPIEIPAGVEDGDRLRLAGEGEAGAAGGGRGDLYVRFVVRPHERFVRAGDELVTWAEIPMTTAALGGEVQFESLDGEELLRVPSGTQSGATFRISGRGAPRRLRGERGDLLVRAHVLTPTDLDGEQEELLRRLAELRGEHTAEGRGFIRTLRRVLGMEA